MIIWDITESRPLISGLVLHGFNGSQIAADTPSNIRLNVQMVTTHHSTASPNPGRHCVLSGFLHWFSGCAHIVLFQNHVSSCLTAPPQVPGAHCLAKWHLYYRNANLGVIVYSRLSLTHLLPRYTQEIRSLLLLHYNLVLSHLLIFSHLGGHPASPLGLSSCSTPNGQPTHHPAATQEASFNKTSIQSCNDFSLH